MVDDRVDDHVLAAGRLREEAREVLARTRLPEILGARGPVEFTGSFAYDLMTRRDIDVCLSVADPTVDLAFATGRDLASLPGAGSLYYRNEYVLRTPGNPLAIFLCLELVLSPAATWKIDVLMATADVVGPILAAGREIAARLTPATREAILRIKGVLCTHPDYRRKFRSTDIYEAVLSGGVRTVPAWWTWLGGRQEASR